MDKNFNPPAGTQAIKCGDAGHVMFTVKIAVPRNPIRKIVTLILYSKMCNSLNEQ